MATLRDVLKNTTNTLHQHIAYSLDEAKLEARFILEHILKITQKEIIQESNRIINISDQKQIEYIIKKRITGIPLPYLLGEWSFYGRAFKVNRNVLIPRADTEVLIEKVLSKINKHDTLNMLDLGCGTGIIGITLALERPLSKVMLIDQSEDALKNTKENKKLHQVSNITIQKSNWFCALNKKKFHVIASNPPYLKENDPHLLHGLQNEPLEALISGPEGIEAIEYIVNNAKTFLELNGWLIIEHGYDQAKKAFLLFKKNNFSNIGQSKDINNIIRITYGQIQ